MQKSLMDGIGETVLITEPAGVHTAAKEKHKDPTFSSVVLKWTIENIMNKNMYKNKVTPIPMRFSDRTAYFKTFKWLLLEETRAQVQQSLEAVGSKPYIPLKMVEKKTKDDATTHFHKFELSIGGRGSVVQRSNDVDGPWLPKANDLVLLTTFVPESLEDFGSYRELYLVAKIISRTDDEETMPDDMPFAVTATAVMDDESPMHLALCDNNSKRGWYLVFLESLVTAMRIWNALAGLAVGDANYKVANEILLSEQGQKNGLECASLEDKVTPDLKAAVENYCSSRELNSSQTKATTTEYMSLKRKTGCRVSLIQGPPGTGKTKTTTTIVSIAASLKDRVLVSAPTNRAISEIAERFLLLTENGPSNASSFADLVTTATKSEELHSLRNVQLGDVLMIGNKKRLDTDGILGKIFLARRVGRLQKAVLPGTGWNPSRTKMLDFLRNGLENFRLQEELRKEDQSAEPVDFLQFTKINLSGVAEDMIESGRTICNDLPTKLVGKDWADWADRIPTNLLSPGGKENIRNCCDLAEMLLGVVVTGSLAVEDILQCFDGDGLKCALLGHESAEARLFCSARKDLLERLSDAPICGLSRFSVEDFCLQNAGLIFCTTTSAGSRSALRSGLFNVAIVDEAAQVVEAETAIITQHPGLERLLLVGDPKQLPALVTSQMAKDCGYGRSLFERLQASGYVCYMLNEQYRMHPAISQFPNNRFYHDAVLDGANVRSEKYRKPYQDLYGSYAFINVGEGVERKEETSQSWKNTVEAEVVRQLVVNIRAAVEENQHPDIGVITPYRGQVDVVRKRLSGCGIVPLDTGTSTQRKTAGVVVNTVDGFQGGEKDVIIFSAVRANMSGNIGFVKEPRRLNVAITRGRYCVWIVGHARTLGKRNELWAALIQDARARGCFWNANYDTTTKDLVIQVVSEENKSDSFLRHNSILLENLIWQVHFSKEFKDTIMKMNSAQYRQKVISSVMNLAKGVRPSDALDCTSAANEYKRLIHQQRIGEPILVWTIDVQRIHPVKQVIRVWDVTNGSRKEQPKAKDSTCSAETLGKVISPVNIEEAEVEACCTRGGKKTSTEQVKWKKKEDGSRNEQHKAKDSKRSAETLGKVISPVNIEEAEVEACCTRGGKKTATEQVKWKKKEDGSRNEQHKAKDSKRSAKTLGRVISPVYIKAEVEACSTSGGKKIATEQVKWKKEKDGSRNEQHKAKDSKRSAETLGKVISPVNIEAEVEACSTSGGKKTATEQVKWKKKKDGSRNEQHKAKGSKCSAETLAKVISPVNIEEAEGEACSTSRGKKTATAGQVEENEEWIQERAAQSKGFHMLCSGNFGEDDIPCKQRRGGSQRLLHKPRKETAKQQVKWKKKKDNV